jgi:hypothetical protein
MLGDTASLLVAATLLLLTALAWCGPHLKARARATGPEQYSAPAPAPVAGGTPSSDPGHQLESAVMLARGFIWDLLARGTAHGQRAIRRPPAQRAETKSCSLPADRSSAELKVMHADGRISSVQLPPAPEADWSELKYVIGELSTSLGLRADDLMREKLFSCGMNGLNAYKMRSQRRILDLDDAQLDDVVRAMRTRCENWGRSELKVAITAEVLRAKAQEFGRRSP